MRLEDILREIENTPNGFSHACVINTRCKEAAQFITDELLPVADQQQAERYKWAIDELNKVELLLNKYAKTLDSYYQGDLSLFADLRNKAYNVLEAIVTIY